MAQQAGSSSYPRVVRWLVIVLLAWIVVAVTFSQRQMAPTFDEQNHVTRGIAILHTGDYRLVYHHPPLANILEALPVAWHPDTHFTPDPAWWQYHPHNAHSLSIWEASNATLWHDSAHGVHLIQLARMPVLLFTLVLALVVFLWSAELFGPWGGLFSLALFALDPTVLAHSGLATTDMAAACTIVLAVYWLRRYVRQPSTGRLLAAGAGVGLALAAKFTGLILIPICGLILLDYVIRLPRPEEGLAARWAKLPLGTRLGRMIGVGLLILVVGGVVLWGTYGLHVEMLGSKPGVPVAASASLKARLPIPAYQYLRGLKTVKSEADGHLAYLLGKTDTSGKGWWYYFPVALAVKTPIPELLAIVGILMVLCLPRARRQLALPAGELPWLLIPIGLYTLAALGVLGISLNLGIRHVLPLFPFLLILAGGWAALPVRVRWYRPLLGVALIGQLVTVGCAGPDFLAYFNEAAGGAARGYRILADSNCDWGQDLGKLAELQRTLNLQPLTLSYFGTTPPAAYGLQCRPATGFGLMREAPAPNLAGRGYLAVSVTNLVGGPGYTPGVDYRPLLRETPFARAGQTIFVYRLPLNGVDLRAFGVADAAGGRLPAASNAVRSR